MSPPQPGPEPVLLAIEDGVATLSLNRPQAHNALDQAAVAAFAAGADQALGDPSVRVILIRANGAAFGPGADLHWLDPLGGGAPARVDGVLRILNPLMLRLRAAPAIVVAAVHGLVVGGSLGLMNMADLVIAAADARFSTAYTRIGATPDLAASFLLPRLLGERKALELLLLADPFDAAAAQRLGLVNFVVPPERLEAEARALAQRLRRGAADALARTKRLAYAAAGSTLAAQLEAERQQLMEAAAGGDFREGVAAFLSRRPPRFA